MTDEPTVKTRSKYIVKKNVNNKKIYKRQLPTIEQQRIKNKNLETRNIEIIICFDFHTKCHPSSFQKFYEIIK